MPYNTTAIPPRKEVTGQTQLPLTRVKKIIAADADIGICSNNAAFVITLATEMFIQHLSSVAQEMAKLERKPRRNIQYKDLANAASRNDNLEFLEDVIPKTTTYRAVRTQAAQTRARLKGEKSGPGGVRGVGLGVGVGIGIGVDADERPMAAGLPNGSSKKRQKASSGGAAAAVNGAGSGSGASGFGGGGGGGGSSTAAARAMLAAAAADEDPSAQLAIEMRQAREGARRADRDGDVDMVG